MFSTIAACALAVTLVQPASRATGDVVAGQSGGLHVLAASAASAASAVSAAPTAPARSHVLTSLYVSYVGLQALDVHSTSRALASGGREANPALRGIAGSPGALIAVKAATTAGTLWVSEQLRKKHPAAAIGLMAALNSVMAVVVSHNYSVR